MACCAAPAKKGPSPSLLAERKARGDAEAKLAAAQIALSTTQAELVKVRATLAAAEGSVRGKRAGPAPQDIIPAAEEAVPPTNLTDNSELPLLRARCQHLESALSGVREGHKVSEEKLRVAAAQVAVEELARVNGVLESERTLRRETEAGLRAQIGDTARDLVGTQEALRAERFDREALQKRFDSMVITLTASAKEKFELPAHDTADRCEQLKGALEAQRAAYRQREVALLANAEAEASVLRTELASQRELLTAAREQNAGLASQLAGAEDAVTMAEAAVDAIEAASIELMDQQTQQALQQDHHQQQQQQAE